MKFIKPTDEELTYLRADPVMWEQEVDCRPEVAEAIERTTGIRAPEQTTEEFLREISQANTFNRDTNERLRNFLESADLVKFAAFRPRQDDVEESFSRAKIFIGLKPQEPARQTREAAV